MRILIAGQTYFPGSNGQAVFSIHLAEGLAKAGHQVTVLVPSGEFSASKAIVNGVVVEKRRTIKLSPYHPETYYSFPYEFGLARIFEEYRPQVVHLQDHYPLAVNAAREARRRGLPLMGTNHFLPENLFPYIPRIIPRRLAKFVLWRMMLDVYNQFDLVTTPTETAACILREQDIRPQVVPVSCGVDTSRFRLMPEIDRAAIRRKYGMHPDKPLFLYIGRLDGEKRIDLLVDAFAKLGREDAHLGIGGKGAQAGPLKSQVRRLGLGKRVTLTGYIPHTDLPLLLNSADVFCMPSPEELQSIATLEAMATGRPILAANARALPELVNHGVNGLLFEPGSISSAAQCMAGLLDQPGAWPRMGCASLEKARMHSLGNTVKRYLALYQEIIDRKQGV